ncbi:hypothetical protein C8J57DRAFT_1049282, partial [Mycena rebaudengoi]
VPFYHLYNPRSRDHLYTTSLAKRNAAGQYTKEGIVGYIYPRPICNAIPLYRLYNNQDHFHTIDEQEVCDAKRSGYRLEYIAGYILPN